MDIEEVLQDKFYLINKPKDWTSFDVVKKIRNIGKFKKIGHAGTLDPLATGLLIICVGKYTKKIEYFQSLPKEYTGTFVLGKTTPSIDLETEFDDITYSIDHIDNNQIELARRSFLGEIDQLPPIYSAIKLNGERLYTHARNGVNESELEIKIRKATIYDFDINTDNFPEIGFRILCSKGTYIRSIVRDFGLYLNSGAYLSLLIRNKIGDYSIERAQEVATFNPDLHESLS
ncbi:tRNA pseudouridine(55) synthase TruB [Aquirufa sp. ROCK-SH2]